MATQETVYSRSHGATTRQKTFSAARQGAESPRARTEAYIHDHRIFNMQIRDLFNADADRRHLQAVQAVLLSVETILAGGNIEMNE
ncbi:hypothetical protein VM1G_02377 [Cytospora mali]|uniref:Uncharacterized protein n=1 Tax=Cytospora mali TaxID=578113 RepID=A0A194VR06_CYTMA|nr:hypothetical protein VM1G_02377 [Valsa mali]